jgi:hypothetical protein
VNAVLLWAIVDEAGPEDEPDEPAGPEDVKDGLPAERVAQDAADWQRQNGPHLKSIS